MPITKSKPPISTLAQLETISTLAQLETLDLALQTMQDQVTWRAVRDIRTQVIIPYCWKHNYAFSSGMGSWSFWDNVDSKIFCPGEDTRWSDEEQLGPGWCTEEDRWYQAPTQEDLKIKELLDFEFCCDRSCMGSYMEPYDPATDPKP